MLIYSHPKLCYFTRKEGFETKLRHENANFFIDKLRETGRHVVVTKNDHELIRTDFGKGAGFSTDFAAAVHVILLADMYELDSLSVGMPLENAYFYHGYKGRDFAGAGLENALKDVQRLWLRFAIANWTFRGSYLQNR